MKKQDDENNTDTAIDKAPDTDTASPESPSSADLGDIAESLIESMPEIQEHAITQERETESAKNDQFSHLVDVSGNSFDPDLHKTNKAGEPTTSTKGNLIKKAGRKPKANTSSVGGAGGKTSISEDDQLKIQSRASGVMTANLLLQVGIVAGGSEWYPQRDVDSGLDEKRMLENAFADYFEATGKQDLPPSMALMVAVGAYALPRFTMPKTKTRVQKMTSGIKAWYVNRKLKKHGLKVKPTGEKKPDTKSASLEA
tara:strand:- start:5709 stop:6473 length:765 start_codon:yes stop_codon:yes gene_type:complete